MRVGEAIRQYREAHSMTTADFARLVGLSRPYVYMLEVNKHSRDGKPIVPSMATLMKVSKVINVPITDLLDGQTDNEDFLEEVSDESTLLERYRQLNDTDKQTIRLMMDRFLQLPVAAPA
ncbi:MAG: helix-turn-helix transcriptional regulator [Selenomonadaceae bacterium]|nr:helix-turn-helix transcriptional regulator [Selenomonadaceae bacterium]